jgi:hypothetical protein
MVNSRSFAAMSISLCVLVVVSQLHAQAPYQFSVITGTGRRAPVPSRIGTANSPTINGSDQIAYEADGGVFLRSGAKTHTIAAIGEPAPGGGQFLSAGSPSLNSKAHVAFVGAAQAPSGSGIFLFAAGKNSLVAAEGQITSVGPIFGLNSPSLNASDEVAFLDFNDVFTEANGIITKIASSGDPSPEGDIFSSFSFPQINATGQVIFTASLASGTSGIYLAANGSITKIVNSNDASPVGGTFAFFFGPASINDSGQIAFAGIVNGPGTSSGIYVFSAGQFTIKVPEFAPFGNGLQLDSVDSPSINNAGDIAFSGQLLGAVEPGIFVTQGGSVTQIIVPGHAAPDGGLFTSGFNPALSNSGHVVFGAREQAVNNTIFLFSNSQLTRVAGPGDLSPGRAKFTFPFTGGGMNKAGMVLFEDVTFPGGFGLFTGNEDSEVQVVANTNERLPDGGSLFNFYQNLAINDAGQVVFNTGGFASSSDLLLESRGTLTQIARGSISNGDPAPDGGTFFNFGRASINNLGQVAFAGSTIGGVGQGLYRYDLGQVGVLLDDASATPPGITLGTFSSPSLNDLGDVAFFNQPFPQPNAILFLSGGSLALITQDGSPAPGGGNFSMRFPDPSFGPSLNVHDQIVFSANLSTGGEAVFLYSQGSLLRIAGPGDPTPDGATFASANFASINATGEIVFAGTTNSGDSGIYAYNSGTLVTVAHAGTRISPLRALVAAFLPAINASGKISFTGALADGTNVILIAAPANAQSTALPVGSTSDISTAAPVASSPKQARAISERASHTGVFASPDPKVRGNGPASPR